jgi:hypothetical protein
MKNQFHRSTLNLPIHFEADGISIYSVDDTLPLHKFYFLRHILQVDRDVKKQISILSIF